jgi:hypothetical protein
LPRNLAKLAQGFNNTGAIGYLAGLDALHQPAGDLGFRINAGLKVWLSISAVE